MMRILSNMIKFSAYILHVIQNMNCDVRIRMSSGHRGFRSCISPSLLKLGKTTTRYKDNHTKQARYFFDPLLLYDIGEVNVKERDQLSKRLDMDVGGVFNCAIGTMVHELILYPLEEYLRAKGFDFVVEFPMCNPELGLYGTADMILFDNEDGMHIYDLKTTGEKILKRSESYEPEHARQLYAYTTMLEYMFPEKKVKSIHVVSICKTPNSMGIDPAGERVRLPIVAQCEVSLEKIRTDYGGQLELIHKEVIRIHEIIKKHNPKWEHWVLDREFSPSVTKSMKKLDERLEKIDKD